VGDVLLLTLTWPDWCTTLQKKRTERNAFTLPRANVLLRISQGLFVGPARGVETQVKRGDCVRITRCISTTGMAKKLGGSEPTDESKAE